ELAHDEAADGIELLVTEIGLEVLIELLDRGQRLHREMPLAVAEDVYLVLDVVLVDDLAHDLLEHVLDRHEAVDAAVLVDDERHVIATRPELLEQDVQA